MIKNFLHAYVWAKRHKIGLLLPKEVVAIMPYLQKGTSFIDIGAHAGSWSVPLAKGVP